jgi:hypothetical protein
MPVYRAVMLPGETQWRQIYKTPGATTTEELRDPMLLPYLTSSHVNQPIGNQATRGDSGLNLPTDGGGKLKVDPIFLSAGAGSVRNLKPIDFFYNNASGKVTLAGGAPKIPVGTKVRVTDDMLHDGYMNGLMAAPDETDGKVRGRYIHTGQALYRLTAADDPAIAYWGGRFVDIWGDGRPASQAAGHQGHGGSGLPIFGMTLRESEWNSTESPKHVLALNLHGKYLSPLDLNGNPSDAYGGWKEPADRADGGFNSGDTTKPNTYWGDVLSMRMGTLLALPASYSFSANGITDADALRLGWTLKYYGIRIVDVTGLVDTFAISAQSTIETTIANKPMAFHSQMLKMIVDCDVITNDTLGQFGGPGARLITPQPEIRMG